MLRPFPTRSAIAPRPTSSGQNWGNSEYGGSWFLNAIQELIDVENELRAVPSLDAVTPEMMLSAKQNGFIDRQLAMLWKVPESEVRKLREVATRYRASICCIMATSRSVLVYPHRHQLRWQLRMP